MRSTMDLDARYAAAVELTRETGNKAAEFFRRRHELAIEYKGVQDVVSIADRAAEDHIVDALVRRFPEDRILGEEGGFKGGGGKICWVIDPIDGTANFLRGISHWCVSVGMLVEDRLEIAVIYDPILDEIFTARRGQGAFLNGRRIDVSGETDLQKARFGIGFSFRHSHREMLEALNRMLTEKSQFTRMGSGALALAYIAAGRAEGFWEKHINAWDVAAGLLLVTEAGGRVNDFFANHGLERGNEVIAATPGLYDRLQSLTRG